MEPITASEPPPRPRRTSTDSQNSVTAMDYINSQLALESEAREIMPYAFDSCTNALGPLRQPVFSCKTCQVPTESLPKFAEFVTKGAAGICYSCSISCHGDHELVEIFNKRDVVCDCGTDRMPQGSSCDLRKVAGEKGRVGNRYCHNYWGRFCWCDMDYDPESEKGTMYQCLLGDACGEDWFHDGCIVGEKNAEKVPKVEEAVAAAVEGKQETVDATAIEGLAGKTEPTGSVQNDEEEDEEERPAGFPEEESFEHYICWLCVEKNPWLLRYAGTPGFLSAVDKKDAPLSAAAIAPTIAPSNNLASEYTAPGDLEATIIIDKKRKAEGEVAEPGHKRAKTPDAAIALSSDLGNSSTEVPICTYNNLPPLPPSTYHQSLFFKATFRTHLCRCPTCFPLLAPHPCLLEEEESYEPPLDASEDGASVHSGGSLFDRGERALGMVDRVHAIEGVMAYNQLKEKVKDFLKPFAASGEAVGADDVKRYFAELRGDVPAKKNGGGAADVAGKREESAK
ncbi:hypothetical protein DFP73DRAFT_517259 [Morchella snyderi]|nr:hypothetical protein DFP73DRAFT_517259 [Morchella snyderi]